jgi:hypothetical protein
MSFLQKKLNFYVKYKIMFQLKKYLEWPIAS